MQQIDVTGLKAPLPILKIRRALSAMAHDDVLMVVADDPDLVMVLPAFCEQAGHRLIMARQNGPCFYFELARGGATQKNTPHAFLQHAS
ncbi:hypothetical protein JCM17846_23920 [Iodidimonas nitroreducens]|uniref:UPF0033 domain-containing protein n=1 Tax=Iodidimonas nitroreducens TaxID=1236968 RepID=A0A5A7NB45_9PROT|nr:sulfurtransferase TusA family protein [Iodidimonas nitroreducens]GAK34259.1 hypothetical protein AQ1_02157 [alpha proteobacterium Q-1]GER04710.1 hypothetical protein JCM17846_23920 [Iodidimonas nitroreducens]